MRNCLITFVILAVTILTGTEQAYAWGQNGHRITAEIGERNVNPHTKTVIKTILGDESLAEIVTWPDDIRSDSSWGLFSSLAFFLD